MNNLKRFVVFWATLLLTTAYAGAQEDSGSVSQSSEVENWYREYASYWYSADVNVKKVSEFYASPFYYLAATGPLLDNSETIEASLQSFTDEWESKGWTGSRLLDIEVKILNSSSAMISTAWDIQGQNGESIIGCDRAPWTYLAAKTDKGWKLTLEIEIACGEGLSLSSE